MENKKEYIKVTDSFLTKENFFLFLEKDNEMLTTFPKPKKEDLPRYYQAKDYISHKNTSSNFFQWIYFVSKKIMIKKKARMILKIAKGSSKIVDVGSGVGDFLIAFQKKGWLTTGIEPNTRARNIAKKQKVHHANSLKELKGTKQDLITFWHSLEHVYLLEQTLLEAKEALRDKGFLIVACPNYKSWDAKYYGSKWAAWDVPRHLQHFSPNSLSLLLGPLGFVQKSKSPLLLDALYVSILSEKQQKSWFAFFKGVFFGTISNLIGLFTDNFSSHIYIFQKKEK